MVFDGLHLTAFMMNLILPKVPDLAVQPLKNVSCICILQTNLFLTFEILLNVVCLYTPSYRFHN